VELRFEEEHRCSWCKRNEVRPVFMLWSWERHDRDNGKTMKKNPKLCDLCFEFDHRRPSGTSSAREVATEWTKIEARHQRGVAA